MNNSLFTQTFTRLKPVKYLTNLARLKHLLKPCLKHLKSLSALILATLLLAACGGGGGGGGGSSTASPATTVTNFNVVPAQDRMTLSWTNPNRADIASINISWAAYNKDDLSISRPVGDGSVMLNQSAFVATTADNSHNLVVGATALNGIPISGTPLDANNAYVFSLQLSFTGGTTPRPQLPDIPAPNFPRAFGPNTDGNSFAVSQVYSVNFEQPTINGGNVTLMWINPQVSAGNITSVLITYQSNLSTSEARGSILLTSSEYLGVASTTSYTWTDLAPGQYNFTIQPILGDIFVGVEVVPDMLNDVTVSELSATSPTAVAVSPTTIVMANTVAAYTDGINITTTVTDNDPNNGEDPTLMYTTSPAGSCSVSDEVSSGFDPSGVATETAKVTLLSAGTRCVVTATPNKAVNGAPATFRIAQAHIAPLLAIPDTATGMEGAPVEFNVTATKQDVGATTAVTFASTFTADGCTMARMDPATVGSSGYTSIGDTYTQVYSATRAGSGNCTIPKSSFTATEDAAVADGGTGNIVISFLMAQPPLVAITAGAASVDDLLAIPGTAHEITVTATKQDMSNIAEVMFTSSFADASDTQHCDVNITNPTVSYVGGGVDGIGGIATTNITISYSGILGSFAECQFNLAAKEGSNTGNLPLLSGVTYAIDIRFNAVNQPPLLELSGVPADNTFPDDQLRIGVEAIRQDVIPELTLKSAVNVANGACTAIIHGFDTVYPSSGRLGVRSSIAYYNIILDAANAISADAADRQCELDFSVTETETDTTTKTTNRTIFLSFAQELPPLFVNISTSTGNSVTSPSNRDVLVNITLEKQDASRTEILTLPDTISSVGDVCTATLRNSARYAATSIGSVANATYAVGVNNVAISENTACGAFVFTATEGSSATSNSTSIETPAIIFTPSVERPPAVVLNAAASTIDDLLNSVVATIAVNITKQDNAGANLVVTEMISEGSCSIRELTNTGYGANPVLGSIATASYEITYTGSRLVDGTCRVNIIATEDDSSGTLSQEVVFRFSNLPPSAAELSGNTGFIGINDYINGRIITTTITDGDPDDGERPTVSYSTAPGGCRVVNPSISSFVGATATATATVMLVIREGESLNAGFGCVVTVTPHERVSGTSTTFTTFGSDIAPLVSVPDTAAGVAGTPVEFTVTATKQDPGFTMDIVFATDITASADCTVTAGAVTLGSPANIGDTYTRVYSVARATAGDCSIAKSMFVVREDTPIFSARTASGGGGNIVISFSN